MSHEQFSNYKAFASYLQENGWVAEGAENSVITALAAFEAFQRKAGIEKARGLMNKACDKAR